MTRSGEWLVAVTAGRWQAGGIQAAKKEGLRVFGVDGDPDAESARLCDAFLTADIRDASLLAQQIRSRDMRAVSALSFCSEVGMVPAARLRALLALPGDSIDVTHVLTNKGLQRARFAAKDVSSVDYAVCRTPEAAQLARRSLGQTVVVKPTDSAGSMGVHIVNGGGSNLHAAVLDALEVSREGAVIIEEFVSGTEYTVELFGTASGWVPLAITEKRKAPGSLSVSQVLVTIDLLSAKARALADTASAAADAVGARRGVAHAELIWNDERGPVLIEIAGRGGGFMLNDGLVPASSGVDVNSAQVRVQRDDNLQIPQSLNRPTVLGFLPSRPGVLRAVDGMTAANEIPGVAAGLAARLGHAMDERENDGQRVAYILSCADTAAEARTNFEHALSLLRAVYE